MKNKERVFLLAASNLPWDLDVAMLRRLEKRVTLSIIAHSIFLKFIINNIIFFLK